MDKEAEIIVKGENSDVLPACIEWVRSHKNVSEAIIDTTRTLGALPCYPALIKLKFESGLVECFLAETGRGPVKFVPTPRVVP